MFPSVTSIVGSHGTESKSQRKEIKEGRKEEQIEGKAMVIQEVNLHFNAKMNFFKQTVKTNLLWSLARGVDYRIVCRDEGCTLL